MSTDVTHPRVIFPASQEVGAGEELDLSDLDQVAAWSHELGKLWGAVRFAKDIVDTELRSRLAADGRVSMILADGALEVTEEPGRAAYDGEKLAQGLLDAGLDRDVVAAMFKPELRDARELGKLERRSDAIAKAAEAARTRGRGRIKVSRKRAAVPAPVIPGYVREASAAITREDDDARARGI